MLQICFFLLENTLEGNTIIQPELKSVEVNEGKAQTLLNTMSMTYIVLSTFCAVGFMKSYPPSINPERYNACSGSF